MKKAFFLDRDGVINRMVKYDYDWDSPQNPQDVRLVNGIEKVILWANKHKILVVEISNQPGVAKGKMSQEMSDVIEEKVHQLLKEKGVFVNKTYICSHHPQAVVPELKIVCDCRKPKPGLLLMASKELNLDLRKSVILGDKASDAEAGKNAGCKTVLFIHDEDVESKVEASKQAEADYKILGISEAVPILQKIFKSG